LKDHSAERKAQLRTAFGVIVANQKEKKFCIFGGDLNVREAEVKSVKVPESVVDVWEACGSDRAMQYTWDVKNNDNLAWPYPNRPQARYDRVYCTSSGAKLRPTRFELVGQDRLHQCGRFPSDHWGLWVEFDAQQ
jgi:tyrosyl-DNA phosphodiesterase 2